jgi:hypothetical protein
MSQETCPECGGRRFYIAVEATMIKDFETGQWRIDPDSIDFDEVTAQVTCYNNKCDFSGTYKQIDTIEGIGGRRMPRRR